MEAIPITKSVKASVNVNRSRVRRMPMPRCGGGGACGPARGVSRRFATTAMLLSPPCLVSASSLLLPRESRQRSFYVQATICLRGHRPNGLLRNRMGLNGMLCGFAGRFGVLGYTPSRSWHALCSCFFARFRLATNRSAKFVDKNSRSSVHCKDSGLPVISAHFRPTPVTFLTIASCSNVAILARLVVRLRRATHPKIRRERGNSCAMRFQHLSPLRACGVCLRLQRPPRTPPRLSSERHACADWKRHR